MKHRDNRIEPTFEEDEASHRRQADPPPLDLEPETASIYPAIKFAAIAVVLACLFFVGERLYIHYQARQAVKVLERELDALGTHMTHSLEQAGAAMERMNQQAKARAAAAQKQQQERIEEQRRAHVHHRRRLAGQELRRLDTGLEGNGSTDRRAGNEKALRSIGALPENRHRTAGNAAGRESHSLKQTGFSIPVIL